LGFKESLRSADRKSTGHESQIENDGCENNVDDGPGHDFEEVEVGLFEEL
jgi:hypothetical protein